METSITLSITSEQLGNILCGKARIANFPQDATILGVESSVLVDRINIRARHRQFEACSLEVVGTPEPGAPAGA